jgi:membrane protease YdiL (CAAX protease family)
MQNWVRTHQLTAFLLWFFTIGWGIAFIPLVVQRVSNVEVPVEGFLIAATLFGLLLPALAITWLTDGRSGVVALWRRAVLVRASLGWYVLAVIAVPVCALALAILVYGLPQRTPTELLSAITMGLIVQSAIGLVTINLWEEIAWMGFVQARLQARHGIWAGVTLTAALFTLQHVPLFVDNGPAVFIILPIFFLVAIPFRALIAWMFNRTGSLFLVGLLHAVSDGTGSGGFSAGFLPRLYDSGDVALFANLAVVPIGLLVIAATRLRLGAAVRSTRGAPAAVAAPAVDPVV